MANRVLPALGVLLEVGKTLLDEVIDLVESHHASGRALDGHGDESNVGVGRLDLGKASLLLRQRRRAAQMRHIDRVELGDEALLDRLFRLRLAYMRLYTVINTIR